jgi:hypothetical protein
LSPLDVQKEPGTEKAQVYQDGEVAEWLKAAVC